MIKKILFRTDGDQRIGLGHVMRCLALAEMLKEDFEVIFISKRAPDRLVEEVSSRGYEWTKITSEGNFLSVLNGSEIVVLDCYKLSESFQKSIKKLCFKLVCIDDLQRGSFVADLIINHSPGVEESDYCAQPYTRFALGPEFALVRPLFLESTTIDYLNKTENILICFGGADPFNHTKQMLKQLLECKVDKSITIILGEKNPHKPSIEEISEKGENVRILQNLSEKEMLEEIRSSGIAFVPASGILYEIIAVGVFPVVCQYADNQRELFAYLNKENLVPTLDLRNINKSDLKNLIYQEDIHLKYLEKLSKFRALMANSATRNLYNFRILAASG